MHQARSVRNRKVSKQHQIYHLLERRAPTQIRNARRFMQNLNDPLGKRVLRNETEEPHLPAVTRIASPSE